MVIETGPDFQALSDRYMRELEMARRVQQGLLSAETPQFPGIKIARQCISAESVGGDFYTFIPKDTTAFVTETPGVVKYVDKGEFYLGIAIGDVAGHGISSALVMALSSGILSEVGKATRSAAETMRRSNNNILKYIQHSHVSYVTVFYSVLHVSSKKLVYCSAGHPGALFIRGDTVQELSTGDVFLGMYTDAAYQEKEIQLQPGDRVYFYTDGLVEARNRAGEEFGLERLIEIIKNNREKTIEKSKTEIFDAVAGFSQSQTIRDDQTLVILEVG